jgi:hypothetical protein
VIAKSKKPREAGLGHILWTLADLGLGVQDTAELAVG